MCATASTAAFGALLSSRLRICSIPQDRAPAIAIGKVAIAVTRISFPYCYTRIPSVEGGRTAKSIRAT